MYYNVTYITKKTWLIISHFFLINFFNNMNLIQITSTQTCVFLRDTGAPLSYCLGDHLFSSDLFVCYIHTTGCVAEGSCPCPAEKTCSDKDYIA